MSFEAKSFVCTFLQFAMASQKLDLPCVLSINHQSAYIQRTVSYCGHGLGGTSPIITITTVITITIAIVIISTTIIIVVIVGLRRTELSKPSHGFKWGLAWH
jgi:hypothetical protein